MVSWLVTVKNAKNLPFVPSGKIFKEQKPPNSCVVFRTGERFEQTHSVELSVAPVWNSTFILTSLTDETTISIAIFHEGRARRRLLCETNIRVGKLLELQQEGEDIHLALPSAGSPQHTSTLHLRVKQKTSAPVINSVESEPSRDATVMLTTFSPQMIRILCLDGGGVRGLSSLLILRELMVQYSASFSHLVDLPVSSTPIRPCDVFELIVGTGTGGLSALLLGRLRMTVDEAIDQYLQLSHVVVRSPGARLYDGIALEKHIRSMVVRLLGTPEALMFDAAASQSRTAVLAATSAVVDAPPYIFRSYSSVPSFRVIDVARATSATAGVFPSVSFGQPPIDFIDAGSVGYNNPTEVALTEAQKIWPSRDVDVVISLGTGTRPIVNFEKGNRWQALAKKSQQLVESCEAVHERVFRSNIQQRYFRFSVDRGLENIDAADWREARKSLAALTSAYLRHGQPERNLVRCVQAIAGRADIISTHPQISVDKYGLQAYIRDNVQLLREISKTGRYIGNSAVTIGLHRGRRLTDGRLVLVKTYEGVERNDSVKYFSQDLVSRQRIWNPLLLQLVGSGSEKEWVPFQVYHVPGGQFESFREWLDRVTAVESICGLYDMRLSIKDLVQFQADRSIAWSGEAEDLLLSSVVQVQHSGNQYKWTVIYTGEVFTGPVETTSSHEPFVEVADPRRRELYVSFLRGAEVWADDSRDLANVAHVDMGAIMNINPSTLAGTLLEQGWLGTASEKVGLQDNIRLGDIGYLDEMGKFVVVENFHTDLTAMDGSVATWTHTASYAPDETLIHPEQPFDKTYTRFEAIWPTNGLTADRYLAYENLDKQHAWKILQHRASEIVSRHDLVVTPDKLMLVITARKDIMLDLFTLSEDESAPPTVYLFDYGTSNHVDHSGAPVFPQMHASFNPEPDWLDSEEGTETNRAEFQDGWDLQYEVIGQFIHYLQLPAGVAFPYITEVQYDHGS